MGIVPDARHGGDVAPRFPDIGSTPERSGHPGSPGGAEEGSRTPADAGNARQTKLLSTMSSHISLGSWLSHRSSKLFPPSD
eukprot:10667777-Lingulodinium_polyedra.AAC.1